MPNTLCLPIKTITSVLNVLTYIIAAHPIRLTVILVIMSDSTFKAAVIININWWSVLFFEENRVTLF